MPQAKLQHPRQLMLLRMPTSHLINRRRVVPAPED